MSDFLLLLGYGTGDRHAVWKQIWSTSPVTGRFYKLVIPPECRDKKVGINNEFLKQKPVHLEY